MEDNFSVLLRLLIARDAKQDYTGALRLHHLAADSEDYRCSQCPR